MATFQQRKPVLLFTMSTWERSITAMVAVDSLLQADWELQYRGRSKAVATFLVQLICLDMHGQAMQLRQTMLHLPIQSSIRQQRGRTSVLFTLTRKFHLGGVRFNWNGMMVGGSSISKITKPI